MNTHRHRRTACLSGALGAGMLVALGLPAAAGVAAPTAGHRPGGTAVGHPLSLPGTRAPADGLAALGHSRQPNMNWGGYVADGAGHRSVSASWVNPEVSCSVPGVASFWVGFDGWAGSRTVQQVGVDANCRSGTVRYRPWYQAYPASSRYVDDVTATAGDRMTARVTRTGEQTYRLALSDRTRGWTRTTPVTAPRSRGGSVEVVVEPVGHARDVAPLPDFGTVRFTDIRVDGMPMAAARPEAATLARGSEPLADTGPLVGDRYAVRWRRS